MLNRLGELAGSAPSGPKIMVRWDWCCSHGAVRGAEATVEYESAVQRLKCD